MSVAITVIIPMFNARAWIAAAIRSVLDQSLAEIEVLVVDDASTDDSRMIVADIAATDGRVRLVPADATVPRGVARARNRGLDLAAGCFVMFMDSDDTLHPGALAALVDSAQRDNAPASVGDFTLHHELGGLLERVPVRHDRITLREHLAGLFFITHAHAVRRDVLVRSGVRFREDLAVIEDTDVWLRLALAGVWWTRARDEQKEPALVAAYRLRQSSRSADLPTMLGCTARVYRDAYAAARLAGATAADTDVSDERLATLLLKSAVGYATRRVLQGGPNALLEAEGMLASFINATPADTQRAAVTLDGPLLHHIARRAVLMTIAVSPDDPLERGCWVPSIIQWWSHLESTHLITSTHRRSAEARLVQGQPGFRAGDAIASAA